MGAIESFPAGLYTTNELRGGDQDEIEDTMAGLLRKITTETAAGYSSYNQSAWPQVL